jgi:hypothetical protein
MEVDMANASGVYDDDIQPYVIPMPDIGGPYPQIFQVNEDRPFPSAAQLIRAAKAELKIDLGISSNSGLTLDLSTVREAIPHLRDLTISEPSTVTGWAELTRAVSLISLAIVGGEPPEALDISELPALQIAGMVGSNCLSVCENANVRALALTMGKSDATPVIKSRLTRLSLTAANADAIVGQMARPDSLRDLIIVGARQFDCRSLLRLPRLGDLILQSCNGVLNAGVLAELPSLRALELFRCRNVDEPDTVAHLIRSLDADPH